MMLFVGEKPSRTAFDRGWTWTSGRLAAKSLFDALETISIEPRACEFYNLFGDHPDDAEKVCDDRTAYIRAHHLPVIAMGDKVTKALEQCAIMHHRIIHPAARGRIRSKTAYADHIRDVLTPLMTGVESDHTR